MDSIQFYHSAAAAAASSSSYSITFVGRERIKIKENDKEIVIYA
jgi:hypothetical protein